MAVEPPVRHHAERALLDSEHRLQQVLDNSTAIVFAKDQRGRYLFVNRAFEQVTGRPAAGMLGRTDEEIFPPDLAARFRHNDRRVLLEKRSIQFEEAADFGSGPRTFLSSKFPLLDADGAAYAVCGISTDITDRKRLEEAFSAAALAVSQSEEETLYRQLARYLSTILGIDGAFVATVSSARPNELQMLAFHLDGDVVENFSYPMAGTPCETVVGQCYRVYPERLTKLFPLDEDFRRLQLESYAGHPLSAADGRPLGLIAAISRRPFADPALVEATLRIFAVRVVAELERAEAAKALRASEEQYRAIFNASADALMLWNSRLQRVDVNSAHQRIFGYAQEEVVGRAFEGTGYPEEFVRPRLEMVQRALAGVPSHAEIEALRKDGRRIVTELRTVPFVHHGEPHVLQIARDITEHRRADAALRASEEQYRSIFNASADGLLLMDREAQVIDANAALCQMFGYAQAELAGQPAATLASDPGSQRWREMLADVTRGAAFEIEGVARRRDGAIFPANVRGAPMVYRGEPHLLVTIRDVTGRVEEQRKLRLSEQRLRATVSSSRDCILSFDAAGRVIEFNPMAEATFGIAAGDVVGRDMVGLLVPPRLADAFRATMAQFEAPGQGPLIGRRMEVTAQRANGEEFDAEVAVSRTDSAEGPLFIAFLRDLTEQKAAAAQREQLQAQLRQAQKMEAIGQLTGGIAHDFNNLLTSIMGYVLLAGQRESAQGDRRLADYLAQAQRSCERARDLIRQMLTFSRGQRGSPRAASLPVIVRGALGTLTAGLPGTLELGVDLDESVAPVHVDPAQVEQVLLNLCLNARDASHGVGRVSLAVRSVPGNGHVCGGCHQRVAGPHVELCVADDGQGMTPEVMERIFEPFYSTKETGKGSGMGLAMVHGIVHEHGGHVVVESEPGRGARFRVLWPALTGARAAAVEAERTTPARAPRPRFSGSVLVVDDEATVGEFMRELLETWGLDAVCEHRPEPALELVREDPRRFDLVITDHSMPGITGLDLARRLRQLRDDLPVIVYTGQGHGLSMEDPSAPGVTAVLSKPIDPARLAELLANCLPARTG